MLSFWDECGSSSKQDQSACWKPFAPLKGFKSPSISVSQPFPHDIGLDSIACFTCIYLSNLWDLVFVLYFITERRPPSAIYTHSWSTFNPFFIPISILRRHGRGKKWWLRQDLYLIRLPLLSLPLWFLTFKMRGMEFLLRRHFGGIYGYVIKDI